VREHTPSRRPEVFDIAASAVNNSNYRTVEWTGRHLQVTLMRIAPGESIGAEVHQETDQFLRVEAGEGEARLGPADGEWEQVVAVRPGWALCVPAGTWHDVVNTGDSALALYSIYAPVHHAESAVHPSRELAEADERAGRDDPPRWAVRAVDPMVE